METNETTAKTTGKAGRRPPTELISVTTAAELLNVGRSTVIYLIDNNRLEAFQIPVPVIQGKQREKAQDAAQARSTGRELYLRRDAVEEMARNGWRNPRFGRQE